MLKRLKLAILQDPIVLAAPMETQLEKRPFTQTILSPAHYRLDKVQKVALGLLIVPAALFFLSGLLSQQWTLVLILGFLLALVGFIVWITQLRSQMFWRVTWHEGFVEVEDGRYGKIEQWTESLSSFQGLKLAFGYQQQRGKYAVNLKVNGLLLMHPDPFKSILLHANIQPIADETIAYYELQLNQKLTPLPAER